LINFLGKESLLLSRPELERHQKVAMTKCEAGPLKRAGLYVINEKKRKRKKERLLKMNLQNETIKNHPHRFN
jgi:hypothetical protein